MTPEQQRIAIAEACGWTEIKPQRATTGISDYPTGKLNGVRKDGSRDYYVPNYPKDLNAMHDAEKVLTGQAASDYDMHLWIVIKRDWDEANNPLATIASWHATAAQRAKAFLRTIGKWKEAK
jgi:hypothetical protein